MIYLVLNLSSFSICFLLFPCNFCCVGGAKEGEGSVGRGGGVLEVEQREWGKGKHVFLLHTSSLYGLGDRDKLGLRWAAT
jgi:hypothetical protein